MKRHKGETLIEIVVFIVIMGIVLSAIIAVFKPLLTYSSRPGYLLVASQLADARMNLIIMKRRVNGFTSISDPCSSGSLNACTGLNTFATGKGYTVTSSIPAAVNGVRTATVTVSGTGNATDVVRFVQ